MERGVTSGEHGREGPSRRRQPDARPSWLPVDSDTLPASSLARSPNRVLLGRVSHWLDAPGEEWFAAGAEFFTRGLPPAAAGGHGPDDGDEDTRADEGDHDVTQQPVGADAEHPEQETAEDGPDQADDDVPDHAVAA